MLWSILIAIVVGCIAGAIGKAIAERKNKSTGGSNPQPTAANAPMATPPAAKPFSVEVSNKYTADGGIFAEGKIKEGSLKVGDRVYVYGKDGNLKYESAKVVALKRDAGIAVQSLEKGSCEYAAIRLDCVAYVGDIEYEDTISTTKLDIKPKESEKPQEPAKPLPEPKTYNDPDRAKHIRMATNDLCGMCASGSLQSNREWVRNVGQDLYDAHGFSAMQETFINVKSCYPMAQSQLSSIWDGVGGWAD